MPPTLARSLWLLGISFAISTTLSLACTIGELPTATRCRPSSPDAAKDCSRSYSDDAVCCSDDPAALDLTDLDNPVPAYVVRDEQLDGGTPLFSADRNDIGASGICVQVGSVAPANALQNGCPTPCNPTWDGDTTTTVCGEGVYCCQTLELDAADCVLDPTLGDSGCWRPARGEDIIGLGGLELTDWSPAALATLQDPDGKACASFVAGLSAEQLGAAGLSADDVRVACLRRLGVADQRGFCVGGLAVTGCPMDQPSYRDACEQLNDDEARSACG